MARALTESSLLAYLKGDQGFKPSSVSVSDLTYAFGGRPQAHTKMLQRLVTKGKLTYSARNKSYSLSRKAKKNFFWGKTSAKKAKKTSFPTFHVYVGRNEYYVTSKASWQKTEKALGPKKVKSLRLAGKQFGEPVFRDDLDRGELLTKWLVRHAK